MNDISYRKIKTGGDPRTLADYAALRDELSKLTHPARPDVSWQHVEKLCLSLFEQNGVELQTAAWYTLARTQQAGVSGLNEGLAILEALISHQWGALWPQPVHARMEILSNLSLRLQQVMRTLPLNYSDLSQLYTAEQQLTSLGAILERLELKHLSQFDTLRTLMHNNAVRLENSDGASGSDAVVQRGILLPAGIMDEAKITAKTPSALPLPQENTTRWVYVPQTEHQPNVDVLSVRLAPTKKWKFFTAGMCTMLAIGAAMLWGWHVLQRPDPLQAQLAASLAPLPVILTPVQRDLLRQQAPDQAFITQTQQQLTRLDKLPPDWNIAYSRQLIEQAQALWPEQTKPLVLQWHQQLNASALPKENLDGWHQGMTKLKQLSERLNRLDEQKGRYMTVSELKSAVFSAMQSFNQTIPAEEQLRALSLTPAGQALSLADKTQLEIRLKQLITRYAEIKQTASEE
ncbi:VasL domain-containing protein [Kosakonia oryzae]|uniref:Type VI secretion system ImpA family N-terminal domain-containing protein n=1 Tax=Kosakonia oryzae TaxID=497725 RepID=A0AA94KQ14_9ENTR|nr:VasL domain-containing protein [Kosakonia oryzae]ANI82047.1 type VI secretion system ImpA family N-terminal domain-containing protein [Kosakonia oryzae]SFC45996.1 type VI secretion system protein VasL [Kosakonia oryzae]